MEAMIVAPAPAQNTTKPKSNNAARSGSESTFAPALNQAINDNKSSSASPTQHSRISQPGNTPTNPRDEQSDIETADENSSVYADIQQSRTDNFSDGKTAIKEQLIAASAQDAATMLSNHQAGLAGGEKEVGDGFGKNRASSTVLTSQTDSLQNQNIQSLQQSTQLTKKSVITAQFAQVLNGSSDINTEQLLSVRQQDNSNTIYLQKDDTITWNQSKAVASNMLSQNTTVLQFLSEENILKDPSQMRIERFANLSELSPQNNADTTDRSTLLSIEKIAGRLTDIPLQTSQAPPALRNNAPSLRQDAQGQFLEAKGENIDTKQHTHTGQQSLDSGDDFSQKSLLGASPKGIEKTGDSSFSQTFQNISSDKPSNIGLETFRPTGGSFLASQAQENNVLHQVIHKFRISQRMQDTKLVMKLHPAELGDLKIDIQLKGGTINANILAQSQQVQHILEKNMPRLKALMEEQGLVVNEIAVNLDTDVSDNRNMFEDHLAQDNQSFSKHKGASSSARFTLQHEEVDEAEIIAQPTPPGVNVMI